MRQRVVGGSASGRGNRRNGWAKPLVLVMALGLVVGSGSHAQSPSNQVMLRNLSDRPIRVYLEIAGESRYIGRVASMSSSSLRMPSDLKLERVREISLSVVSTGASRGIARGADGSVPAVRVVVPPEQLRSLEWTLAGRVLYSAPLRSGMWSARTQVQ